MSHDEAVSNLSSALEGYRNAHGFVDVAGVDVEGRASKTLLQAYLAPLLTGAQPPQELARNIRKVQKDLYSLGVYKDVNLSLSPEGVIKIALPSVNKFVARVGTNVGQNEGSGYLRGTIKNPLGFGEVISFDASQGTRTTSAHLLTASLPIPHPKFVGVRAEALAYSSEKLQEWASSVAQFRGGSLSLENADRFALGVRADLRTLASKTLNFSPSLRHEVGNSFKLSVFCNYKKKIGNMDAQDFENKGTLWSSQTELALPQTTFPFLKSTLQVKNAFPVYRSVTGTVNSKVGFILPLNYYTRAGYVPRTHLLDRFNLGGPLDLRGFKQNHVGPHDSGDALGGELMAATGISLFSPIRGLNKDFRAHAFVNAGALSPLRTRVLPVPSVSSGFGLVYANSNMRVELNFALPVVSRVDEVLHKGFVFGIGLDFL